MWQIYKQNKKLFLSLCVTSFGEIAPKFPSKEKQTQDALRKLRESLELPAGISTGVGSRNNSIYGTAGLENYGEKGDWGYMLSLTAGERQREIWGKYAHALGGNFELAVEANYLMSKEKFNFSQYGSVDDFISQLGTRGELSYKKEKTKINIAAEYVKVFKKNFSDKTTTWEDTDYTYVETLFAGFSGAERYKFVLELEQAITSGIVIKGGILYSLLKEPELYSFGGSTKSALGLSASLRVPLSKAFVLEIRGEKDVSGTNYVGKINYGNKNGINIYVEGGYFNRTNKTSLTNPSHVSIGVQFPIGGTSSEERQKRKIEKFNTREVEWEKQQLLKKLSGSSIQDQIEASGVKNPVVVVSSLSRVLPDYIVGGRFGEGSKIETTEKPKEDLSTINKAPTISNITETGATVENQISDADGIQKIRYSLVDPSGKIIQSETGDFTGLTANTKYSAKTSAETLNKKTGEYEKVESPETSFTTLEAPAEDTFTINKAPTISNITETGATVENQISDADGIQKIRYSLVDPSGKIIQSETGDFTGLTANTKYSAKTSAETLNKKTGKYEPVESPETSFYTLEAPIPTPTAESFTVNCSPNNIPTLSYTVDMSSHTKDADTIEITSVSSEYGVNSINYNISGLNLTLSVSLGTVVSNGVIKYVPVKNGKKGAEATISVNNLGDI